MHKIQRILDDKILKIAEDIMDNHDNLSFQITDEPENLLNSMLVQKTKEIMNSFKNQKK